MSRTRQKVGLGRADWECKILISQCSVHFGRRKPMCMGLVDLISLCETQTLVNIHVRNTRTTQTNHILKNADKLMYHKVIKIHNPSARNYQDIMEITCQRNLRKKKHTISFVIITKEFLLFLRFKKQFQCLDADGDIVRLN